jgi:type II secretory pathway pseudopilin PulG
VGKRSNKTERVRARPGQGGFSLVEVTVLALLLLVAVGGLSGAVLSSLKLARTSEESALADEAVRAQAAAMQTMGFNLIFASYNAAPAAVPGAAFDVRGLTPQEGDPDGRVGRIVFPVVELPGGVQALREDVVEPRLGMTAPLFMDLNNDGDAVDDVTNDYTLLPVRLIVEWTGAGGNRSYELDLLLSP